MEAVTSLSLSTFHVASLMFYIVAVSQEQAFQYSDIQRFAYQASACLRLAIMSYWSNLESVFEGTTQGPEYWQSTSLAADRVTIYHTR